MSLRTSDHVALDAHEQVVEVVGDAAGVGADRLHSLGVAQLGLEAGPLAVGGGALGDVADDAAEARRRPLLVAHQGDRDLDRDPPLVEPDQLPRECGRGMPGREHPLERGRCDQVIRS
jgi:hypothetical protein